jgi:hypothetical protein
VGHHAYLSRCKGWKSWRIRPAGKDARLSELSGPLISTVGKLVVSNRRLSDKSLPEAPPVQSMRDVESSD